MRKINYRDERAVICFILLVSTVFALITGIHAQGDGPSYYLMTGSLLHDGDLVLNGKDVARWNSERFVHVPIGAYVSVDAQGIMRFSKPILYPLFAVPFFLFFGSKGFGILNGLFLGASIAISYLFMRRYFDKVNSLCIVTMFFLCSFIPVYAAWIHAEMMVFFACVLCMWLWRDKNKTMLAAFIIGIVGSVKVLFLLLLLPLIIEKIKEKKIKELVSTTGMCALGLSSMLILTLLFIGKLSPYTGLAGYIPPRQAPYTTVGQVRDALSIVPSEFHDMEFNNRGLIFRNILNFFFGRFTGILWYAFPAVVCGVIYGVYRHRIREEERLFGDSVAAVTIVLIGLLIIFRPLNYFGGKGFVCNRYFFIVPAALFLPTIRLLRKPKKIVLLFLPGLLVNIQVMHNALLLKKWDFRKNISPHAAHTATFPLRYAPLEIFQIESLGVRNTEISNTIFLYAPSGFIKQVDKNILVGKGQEIVIVQKNNSKYLTVETDQEDIILQPMGILKSTVRNECKSFYYFKARQFIWIHNIRSF